MVTSVAADVVVGAEAEAVVTRMRAVVVITQALRIRILESPALPIRTDPMALALPIRMALALLIRTVHAALRLLINRLRFHQRPLQLRARVARVARTAEKASEAKVVQPPEAKAERPEEKVVSPPLEALARIRTREADWATPCLCPVS